MSQPKATDTEEQAISIVEELRRRLTEVERLLARRIASPELPKQDFTVLLVEVSGTAAAIPLEAVCEVVSYAWLTPIPEAPQWAAGVLELGGQAIYVVDVAARIFGGSHCPRVDDFIVICQLRDRQVGLCVNGLRGVETFASSAASPVSADVPAASYLIGTISCRGSPVLLIGLELLLRASELSAPEARA
jgi:chemotaxis signal transduction protein